MLYDVLGDYRKAEAYLIAASEQVGFLGLTSSRIDLLLLGKCSGSITSVQQAICFRSLGSLKSQTHSSRKLKTDLWARVAWSGSPVAFSVVHDLDVQLERLRALIPVLTNSFLPFSDPVDASMNNLLHSIESLDMCISREITSSLGVHDDLSVATNMFGSVIARVKLCHAKSLLGVAGASEGDMKAVKTICDELIKSDATVSPRLRSLTYYFLLSLLLGNRSGQGSAQPFMA